MVVQKNSNAPKTWEILGVFLAYIATVKESPYVLRMFYFSKLLPKKLKLFLLSLNSNSSFWYMIFFTIFCALFLLYLIFKEKKHYEEQPEKDNFTNKDNLNDILNRTYFLSYLKTFGLLYLRNWLVGLNGVEIYGTFKRQSNWAPRSDYFKSIDRIAFKNGTGTEFQYSKNFVHLAIRCHPVGDVTYEAEVVRKPTWKEIRLLFLASNFFPLWFIVHIIKRFFY